MSATNRTATSYFVAAMDTENYQWTALGESEDDALAALADGWDRALTARGATSWTDDPDESDMQAGVAMRGTAAVEHYEPSVTEIPVGGCARDTWLV